MKRNRTSKALLSLAMTAILSLGTAVTAFAGPITPPATVGDDVKILKELKMDNTLSIPSGGFTFGFQFTAKKYNDVPATATIVNGAAMPTVTDTNITLFTADKDTAASTGSTDIYRKEATNKIFDGTSWQAPGAYTYTVTEKASTNSIATDETMAIDSKSYDVTAYVKNDGSGGFEIESIAVSLNGSGGGKVVVTPGLTTNKFIFTNVFSKIVGGTDPTTDASLTVSKTVATSDHADYNKYFEFSMATTASGTETSATVYKAYLMESGAVISIAQDNKITTETYNIDNDSFGDYFKVNAGDTLKLNLKHGQSVGFIGMGAGAKYTATETGAANYTGTIAVTTNGGTPTSVNGALAANVATNNETIGADGINSAAFTNAFNESAAIITPTGITTNDLPFIAMIVLAVGALGAFVVLKSRKRTTGAN